MQVLVRYLTSTSVLCCPQVDVYAFAMIAYELFEGKKPFGNINPIEAARRASMDRVRPEWGKWNNQCVAHPSKQICHSCKRVTH